MAETDKGIRLSKAVKEFNLSTDHILDFLSKKGIKVDNNPNTKLPGEAYVLLQKEFQSDKIAKEEAQQVTQGKMRKEGTLVLDADGIAKPAGKRREEDGEEILIKNLATADYKTEAKPKAKEEPVKEKPAKEKDLHKVDAGQMTGPTIVGKVDIDTLETGKKTDKKKKKTEAGTPP